MTEIFKDLPKFGTPLGRETDGRTDGSSVVQNMTIQLLPVVICRRYHYRGVNYSFQGCTEFAKFLGIYQDLIGFYGKAYMIF